MTTSSPTPAGIRTIVWKRRLVSNKRRDLLSIFPIPILIYHRRERNELLYISSSELGSKLELNASNKDSAQASPSPSSEPILNPTVVMNFHVFISPYQILRSLHNTIHAQNQGVSLPFPKAEEINSIIVTYKCFQIQRFRALWFTTLFIQTVGSSCLQNARDICVY